MDDLNNYAVIGLKHYDALLNEMFTLRQNNAYLNRENGDFAKQIGQMETAQAELENQISHLQAQLDLEVDCDAAEENDEGEKEDTDDES